MNGRLKELKYGQGSRRMVEVMNVDCPRGMGRCNEKSMKVMKMEGES